MEYDNYRAAMGMITEIFDETTFRLRYIFLGGIFTPLVMVLDKKKAPE